MFNWFLAEVLLYNLREGDAWQMTPNERNLEELRADERAEETEMNPVTGVLRWLFGPEQLGASDDVEAMRQAA
jgi:hypothetical protein